MTHTPGPWHATSSGEGLPLTRIGHSTRSPIGGGFNSDVIALLAGTRSFDETTANAHLIAAAPDLLRALLYVWNSIDRVNHPAAKAVEAAINKAQP